jgi:hypothetical protein
MSSSSSSVCRVSYSAWYADSGDALAVEDVDEADDVVDDEDDDGVDAGTVRADGKVEG